MDSPHVRNGRDNSRRTSTAQETTEHQQSTSEMFKDMLSQKRNMILNRLTSFDSEVIIYIRKVTVAYLFHGVVIVLIEFHTLCLGNGARIV